MRGKRTPPEQEELVKSLIYLNPELSERDIAKQANTNKSLVHDIKKRLMNDDEFTQYRAEKKRTIIQESLEIATEYIKHLAEPDIIAKTGARDSVIVVGTLVDKAQLLSGEATIITERKESVPELLSEYEQNIQKLEQLKKKIG